MEIPVLVIFSSVVLIRGCFVMASVIFQALKVVIIAQVSQLWDREDLEGGTIHSETATRLSLTILCITK